MTCDKCHRVVEDGHLELPHPFLVEVSAFGEDCDAHGWHHNALTFVTREDAQAYGSDLFSRWLGAKDFRVVEAS